MQPSSLPKSTFVDDGGAIIRVGDIELRLWEGLQAAPAGDPHCIYLYKDRRFLSALATAIDRVVPARMVEIGVLTGGSTIYWAERYQLQRMAAFEISPQAPLLTQYIARHGLADRIRVHFGIRQDDVPAVLSAIAQDFAGEQIDAVVDDASHQYAETRKTLETLLPNVRNGGVYVIEDWAWGHHKNWPPQMWANHPLMSCSANSCWSAAEAGALLIGSISIPTLRSFGAVRRYCRLTGLSALPTITCRAIFRWRSRHRGINPQRFRHARALLWRKRHGPNTLNLLT